MADLGEGLGGLYPPSLKLKGIQTIPCIDMKFIKTH